MRLKRNLDDIRVRLGESRDHSDTVSQSIQPPAEMSVCC